MKNPFAPIADAIGSLLSDSGKLSIKRFLASLFGGAMIHMVISLIYTRIPAENALIFMHCFDVLSATVCVLTGAATLKDIAAMKYGKKDDDKPPDCEKKEI